MFFNNIDDIIVSMEHKRLADVCRIVSFGIMEEYKEHNHVRIEMNYVRKGSCIMQIEDDSVCFKEGELMIICSKVTHSFQAGKEGCTLMQLEFLPDMFSWFTQRLTDGKGFELAPCNIFSSGNKLIKIINNVRIMRSVQRIVDEMNTRNKYYKHLVIMYYAELLILIFRHLNESYLPMCTNNSMKRAINYIGTHYKDNITISDIACYSKVGERYLRKLFTQHLNLSPLEYMTQIRINKAIELLKITELSIKEVCFQCGFKSPQYFSRIFKRQVGVSPKEISKIKSLLSDKT